MGFKWKEKYDKYIPTLLLILCMNNDLVLKVVNILINQNKIGG